MEEGKMKSNTVIFTEPYKAEIQEIDCPKPGKSEVLIRTEQTLISTGTELTFLTGECPEKSKWSEYSLSAKEWLLKCGYY